MVGSEVRWGIMGAGRISRKFVEALALTSGARVVAVGSRSLEDGRAFADALRIPVAHGSYEALACDPTVDVVYIGTPHTAHKENTLLCLKNGKAVLCEKPFALNRRDAQAMVDAARLRRVFLMEAMWTHFFPAVAKAKALIAEGAIGEVRMLQSSFGFRAGWDPEGRLLNPELAGGALLDVGVYPVSLAHLVFGREPDMVKAVAHLGETNVDEQTGILLGYAGGAIAVLTCALRTQLRQMALIMGTDGWMELGPMFWRPGHLLLKRHGKEEKFEFDTPGEGFTYEAAAVMDDLRAGRLENSVMPHEKTLAIMRTLDRIRCEIGLVYPEERA
jgi:predicted dehydrogenase